MKPTGKCDVCKKKDAKYWYGNTSAATCGDGYCDSEMDKRYEEHCKQVEYDIQFEEEMIAIYGDSYE